LITAIGNPVYDTIKTVQTSSEKRLLSGCSTNCVLALSRLGQLSRLIGVVGEDYKADLAARLDQFGIDYWLYHSQKTGGFALEYYDDLGNRSLEVIARADDLDGINPGFYNDSDVVIIGPILSEISFDEIKSIRNNFTGHFLCDPQGLLRDLDDLSQIVHFKPDGIEEILALFDIVKPNELEGRILTGIDCRKDPFRAAEIIYSWGIKVVIVTLAELGSLIYDGRNMIEIPPFRSQLVDATGAGDTYMAGFIFEYMKTGDLKKAGCFASAVSSCMIEYSGPDFILKEETVRVRQENLLNQNDFRLSLNK
jgi:sugar/nucleoside kinase (ribokinase family)